MRENRHKNVSIYQAREVQGSKFGDWGNWGRKLGKEIGEGNWGRKLGKEIGEGKGDKKREIRKGR